MRFLIEVAIHARKSTASKTKTTKQQGEKLRFHFAIAQRTLAFTAKTSSRQRAVEVKPYQAHLVDLRHSVLGHNHGLTAR